MLLDAFQRPLQTLRLSVTDRCNLRCQYCMPEAEYAWMPRESLLSFEEIEQIVGIFTTLGVSKLRLTGGEPLLRRDLPELIARISRITAIGDLALTTNAVLLSDAAGELAAAGLKRVTVSLDTLRPERFRLLAGRDDLARVLAGIEALSVAGFQRTKLNAVIIRDVNDDELAELLRFGRERGIEVRFLEYMDVGGATQWTAKSVVSREEMLARLAQEFGEVTPLRENDRAPAERYQLSDGTRFGVIASTTAPFCRDCDRGRITADGMWFTCLYAEQGLNLRDWLRSAMPPEEIAARIAAVWRARTDRGAEQRAATPARGPWVQLPQLRADYHLEMHKRGG